MTQDSRPPRRVLPRLWLFSPSRDTQGGSSWLVEAERCDLLIDCPGLTAANLDFLRERVRLRGGAGDRPGGWIVLTGREGHGRCRRLQEALGWPVLVQEQEAYLLPGVAPLVSFAREHQLGDGGRLLWTPGPTPGACVLHLVEQGGMDGLFCGRLLLPVAPGRVAPLRTRRCFHWPRQLASLEKLRGWLPPGSPDWIASAAALGALRGEKLVRGGAELLAGLDLERLKGTLPGGSPGEPGAPSGD